MTSRTVVLLLAACSTNPGASPDATPADAMPDAGPTYTPGQPLLLSANSPGNDEDPAILRARDGSIYVAWFSHSAGDDIVISRTTDGVHWSAPDHISSGAPIDFGPTLYQDAAGVIHAAWFRWSTTNTPPGRIVHARATSPDRADAWGAEVEVTTANATDDWVPTLTANAAGDLIVAYARNTCPPPNPSCYGIEASISSDGGDTWGMAAPVITAGNGLQHHLPAIANTGGELVVAWDPYDATAGAPYDSTQTGSHISVIHSATGATWHDPTDLTTVQADQVTVFPTLYVDHAGAWHAAWLAGSGTGQNVVQVPLANPAQVPGTLPIDGYSPRVVATPTPGVDLAAWVGGPANEHDIYIRVFAAD